MSSFTNALILRDNEDGNTWTVVAIFSYLIGSLTSGVAVTIAEGFVTDLASIPLLRRTGKHNAAAVVHDWLYRNPYVLIHITSVQIFKQPISRWRCDIIFLEAMKVKGVVWPRRYFYWAMVRLFGWIPWRKHRKNDVKENAAK